MIQYSQDRGQSNLLGAILLVAIAIIFFSIYVTQIVPIFTSSAEYSTYKGVDTDMKSINDSISEVASSGIQQTETISFNTDYPFFQFPKHQSQSLYTDSATTTIEYNSTTVNVQSNILNYEPEYSVNDQSSPIHIENGMVVRTTSEIVTPDQGVIDDTTISVTGVSGSFNTADSTNISIRIQQTEPMFSTTVTDDPELTLHTKLSEETWRDQLAEQKTENGGHITNIDYQEYSDSPNQLEIELEENTYTIKTTKVNISR